MRQKHPFLSVIVPIYNEKERLKNIKNIHEYLKGKPFQSEILLVNDGSDKKFEKYLIPLRNQFKNIRLISYTPNKGKGYAIQKGMHEATGAYRLFTDVDLSVPIEAFDDFLPYVKTHQVVIGSRNLKGSRVQIRQNIIRQNMGKVFTFLSQQLLQLPVSDFTCGFKCYSKDVAEKVFAKMSIERWGFDTEVLFICHKMKLSIKEVPIVWKNDVRSKVQFPRDIIFSFLELMIILRNNFRGIYNN